jgi:hypothetical protein
MKIMANHSSASAREEAPHLTNTSRTDITNSLKRRAQAVINDESIDAQSRAIVRYGLETNDPWLPDLVRRIDAGETVNDDFFVLTPQTFPDDSIEEKIQTMSGLICRAGDEPETKSAALLILMAMLETSTHPKALANTVKHFAFAQCGELNLCGMVESQIAVLENELLAGHKLVF